MKILITPRSFGKNDNTPFELLEKHGIEIVKNTTGGIMNEAQLIRAIADCDGVIIGVDPLNETVISAAPKLKAIAKYGVGVDNIALDACKARNIPVSRTVGANSAAVADYAFGLMLALARQIIPIDRMCRNGDWGKITTQDVSEKTLGLIGLGAIGRHMVKRAKGFDMKVMAFDIFWDEKYAAQEMIKKADVDTICRECDFISLHLPLTAETADMIGEKQIEMMKSSAIVINTARGGIIDEDALLKALKENRIAGAGLDAFAEEPPENKEWFELNNVIIGSHCAASTDGAANTMGMMAARNLLEDLGL